jgi:hypothetical protein
LGKVLFYDVAEMTRLFQDYLYNLRQFGPVKDRYPNNLHFISVAGQQLDTRSFTDLAKRTEALPATKCACKRLFCQFRNLSGDFRHQMSQSMIVDLSMIKTRIIWLDAAQIKERAEILREVQSNTWSDQMAT